MNARSTLVAYIQTAKTMQPGQRPLDDPAGPSESAAMWPVAAREQWCDAPLTQLVAVPLGIVAAVALHDRSEVRLEGRMTTSSEAALKGIERPFVPLEPSPE